MLVCMCDEMYFVFVLSIWILWSSEIKLVDSSSPVVFLVHVNYALWLELLQGTDQPRNPYPWISFLVHRALLYAIQVLTYLCPWSFLQFAAPERFPSASQLEIWMKSSYSLVALFVPLVTVRSWNRKGSAWYESIGAFCTSVLICSHKGKRRPTTPFGIFSAPGSDNRIYVEWYTFKTASPYARETAIFAASRQDINWGSPSCNRLKNCSALDPSSPQNLGSQPPSCFQLHDGPPGLHRMAMVIDVWVNASIYWLAGKQALIYQPVRRAQQFLRDNAFCVLPVDKEGGLIVPTGNGWGSFVWPEALWWCLAAESKSRTKKVAFSL